MTKRVLTDDTEAGGEVPSPAPATAPGGHGPAADRVPGGKTRAPSLVVGALILIITTVSLGIEFGGAVRTTGALTAPGLDRQYDINLRQTACLAAMVQRSVPRGAPVYLVPSSSNGGAVQTLLDAVTPWAVPTGAETARWWLSLTQGHCQGIGISVARSG